MNNAAPARPLYQIAADIQKDWGPKMYFGARPYVAAMAQLHSINDKYYEDDAKEVVLYFLANANTWRGEKARTIKAELKNLAGVK